MSDNESQPDTQDDEPDTTVAPTMQAPETVQAWSDDDDTNEPQRQSWANAFGHAGIIVSCGAVLASVAGAVLWVSLRGDDVPPVPPAANQTAAQTISVAPAPTSQKTQPVFTAEQNQRLLNELRRVGAATAITTRRGCFGKRRDTAG